MQKNICKRNTPFPHFKAYIIFKQYFTFQCSRAFRESLAALLGFSVPWSFLVFIYDPANEKLLIQFLSIFKLDKHFSFWIDLTSNSWISSSYASLSNVCMKSEFCHLMLLYFIMISSWQKTLWSPTWEKIPEIISMLQKSFLTPQLEEADKDFRS